MKLSHNYHDDELDELALELMDTINAHKIDEETCLSSESIIKTDNQPILHHV